MPMNLMYLAPVAKYTLATCLTQNVSEISLYLLTPDLLGFPCKSLDLL